MASNDVVKRLETRAAAAEQMIQLLRQQIAEIKQVSGTVDYQAEIESLRKENVVLKKDVESWKSKLVCAEKAGGVPQIPVPQGKSAPVQNGVGEPKKEQPKEAPQQKQEKKDKPKKEKPEGGKKGGGGGGNKPAVELPVDVGR